MQEHQYALELTENSKTGWAFSLSRKHSCINATDLCKQLCYGNGIRYRSLAQQTKRERNFHTAKFLLEKGGSELLSENLCALVDQARPIDWLSARINGTETSLPWTLRIHDVGDMFSVPYVQAWKFTVEKRAACKFWFYTRSFVQPDMLTALSELASFPNCKGLLSIDSENFETGINAFAKYPGIWKLAFLQQEESQLNEHVIPAISRAARQGQVVSFPYHRGAHHVKPITVEPLQVCPQITTDLLPLQRSRYAAKPCQSCALCLPS